MTTEHSKPQGRSLMGTLWPILFGLVVVALFAGRQLRGDEKTDEAERLRRFGELPCVFQGRVKPLDTHARNSLVILSHKQEYVDAEGEKQPAVRWLLDTMTNSKAAYGHKVFRIVNLELIGLLGLERRKGYRYAYEEFAPKLSALQEQMSRAHHLPDDQRGAFENAVIETYNKASLFSRMIDTHMIPPVREDNAFEDMKEILGYYDQLRRDPLLHAIPPREPGDEWSPYIEEAIVAMVGGDAGPAGHATGPHPALRPFTQMIVGWRGDDMTSFDEGLAAYEAWIAENPVEDSDKLGFESFYNRFQPFAACLGLYVAAFLVGCFSWVFASDGLRRAAFWITGLTFALHVFAIASRVHISGYPPVTNLYGSAIFIGAGCVALGLITERLFAIGIGTVVAAITGFATLLIAHFLSLDGDTMEMMQAVLDTKFWLATHVITVTFGYTATYFAGGVAILFLLGGVLTRTVTPQIERMIGSVMYGAIAFALLLSFVGTVLGGLWADDSWGRFWGWDPKENGALMIVIWNAIILHARWAGMIRTRGLALLAVGGNIITTWSWFGVNQLGIGLHSYGFISSVTFWILTFIASQLGLLALGSIPKRYWRSSGATAAANRVASPADHAFPVGQDPDTASA